MTKPIMKTLLIALIVSAVYTFTFTACDKRFVPDPFDEKTEELKTLMQEIINKEQ